MEQLRAVLASLRSRPAPQKALILAGSLGVVATGLLLWTFAGGRPDLVRLGIPPQDRREDSPGVSLCVSTPRRWIRGPERVPNF